MAYENAVDQLDPKSANDRGSTAVPSGSTEGSANPVLSSLAAATQHANELVQQAASQVNKTPQYSSGTSAQPQMPVKKPGLFEDSSVHNLDKAQPQTRAGARNKAIGQIAAQAGGFVRQFMQKKEQQKTQALAQDINRSLELQKGIDEATQVLQTDPNNQAAKATLQKNQTLLGSLLNGKNGKDIAKAYDVTFGEGAKDASEKDKQHKAAMTDAMKQHQQDEKLQQFEGQQPGRMQVNPQYEAAQRNLAAVQKQADALTKTYVTMAGHVMQQENAQGNNQSRERVAAANNQGKIDTQLQKDNDALKLNSQKHQERMQEIGLQGSLRLQAVKIAKQAGDNLKGQKMAEDFAKSLGGQISKNDALITKNKEAIAKLTTSTNEADQQKLKDITDENTRLMEENKNYGEQRDQSIMEMHSDPDASAMYQLIGNDTDK